MKLTSIIFFYVFAFAIQAFAQEQRPRLPANSKELALRIASERERIVSYTMEATIDEKFRTKGETAWKQKPNRDSLKLYMEYSKIDDHFVTAVKNSRQMQKDFRGWLIVGRARDLFMRGSSNGKIGFQEYIEGKHANEFLEYFDPRSTGFLFCGNWTIGEGSRFETIISTLSHPQISEKAIIVRDQNGLIEMSNNAILFTREKLVVDDLRGYWPVSFERFSDDSSKPNSKTWTKVRTEVSLNKIDGIFLPNLAQMFCENALGEERYFMVTLDWQEVNKPLSSGKEGVERLAKKYECSVVDLREQK